MILVAGGTKGGRGKSTVATTLAVMRAVEGRDVLLIARDVLDDQDTINPSRSPSCRPPEPRFASCASRSSCWTI
jgi:hypothetical protein